MSKTLCSLAFLILLDNPLFAEEKPVPLGTKVEGRTSLRDLRGNRRPLRGFADNKAVVVAFLGTACPLANLYVPSLVSLEKEYRGKGVQFLAVYPNESEDLDVIASHAYDRNIPFPVLKDIDQDLAALLGAERVPAVVVLDEEMRIRYRGRINDRYGIGYRKLKATREDLIEALDEVLAGKNVSVPETEVDGCLLEKSRRRKPNPEITFSKHVAPILQKNCQDCHRPGETAPLSLITYDDAVRHARMIKEVATQRRMPPWHADPRYGAFSNDRRMSREDIETLAVWVDSGMPRGDEKDLPKPIDWPRGWVHGTPDLVIEMPEAFDVPAEGTLSYKYFLVDPKFDEDQWVQIAEALPGAREVVHHIVVYITTGGRRRPFTPDGNISVLVGWAPGDLGLVCPPDTALRIPKGTSLLFEMHYTPNGTKVSDRSKIGITFAKKKPKHELMMNPFPNDAIKLPPHDPHYRAEATFRVRADARIIAFVPHMHWRGKHFFYEAIYPDGKKETLLSTPRWDFNWQSMYYFKEPVKVPKGSRIHAVAHWDNSKNNLYNPDPSDTVYFGLQTHEEMMVGWVVYVWENPATGEEMAKNPPPLSEIFFDRMDQNGDEVVTLDEVPERMKAMMFLAGITTPRQMTRKEFIPWFEELRKKFARNRTNPATPGDMPPATPKP